MTVGAARRHHNGPPMELPGTAVLLLMLLLSLRILMWGEMHPLHHHKLKPESVTCSENTCERRGDRPTRGHTLLNMQREPLSTRLLGQIGTDTSTPADCSTPPGNEEPGGCRRETKCPGSPRSFKASSCLPPKGSWKR